MQAHGSGHENGMCRDIGRKEKGMRVVFVFTQCTEGGMGLEASRREACSSTNQDTLPNEASSCSALLLLIPVQQTEPPSCRAKAV